MWGSSCAADEVAVGVLHGGELGEVGGAVDHFAWKVVGIVGIHLEQSTCVGVRIYRRVVVSNLIVKMVSHIGKALHVVIGRVPSVARFTDFLASLDSLTCLEWNRVGQEMGVAHGVIAVLDADVVPVAGAGLSRLSVVGQGDRTRHGSIDWRSFRARVVHSLMARVRLLEHPPSRVGIGRLEREDEISRVRFLDEPEHHEDAEQKDTNEPFHFFYLT
ncbi:MAG: hypothetical protein A3I91_01140 [Candidatus Kerfeldbacteria bacterium RIFCSPLOWO2_02_FULL_42_19]|nr:MAG: hypothetical protein A3I91_01140 [Candidatus Kerfeldbacteria bacterium RIFCSPLOWO2_02_FULL_42_19]